MRTPCTSNAPTGDGLTGASSIRPAGTSTRSPSRTRTSAGLTAAAHAWGRHEAGYGTGGSGADAASPPYSSGMRWSNAGAAATTPASSAAFSAAKPARDRPSAVTAVSCGHTEPVW